MNAIISKCADLVVDAAKKVAKAAAVGAGVAALTALANVIPEVNAGAGQEFDVSLNAIATGQVVGLVILARDYLKEKFSA